MAANRFLIAGGILSAGASLLHLGVIIGGPDWYRFFGAGEGMARMAEQGSWTPTVITLGIASVLAVWSAYAFSGAGVIPRLPLIRTALVLISGVYLLRGLVLIPALDQSWRGYAVHPVEFADRARLRHHLCRRDVEGVALPAQERMSRRPPERRNQAAKRPPLAA